jgi:hypothetical protein
VPTLKEEVIRAWEATVAVEPAHAAMVGTAEASAQEAVAIWDNAVTLIRVAEDWAALAEREARERVSRFEVESAVVLASVRDEAEGFTQRIALLEDELAEVRQA